MEQTVAVICLLIIACWIIAFVQARRMFHLFRKRYPDVARKEIRFAFEPLAHPDKILFFFRRENQDLTGKDKRILALKKQVQGFLFFSFGLIWCIIIVFLAGLFQEDWW